jgi:hypothetical protein
LTRISQHKDGGIDLTARVQRQKNTTLGNGGAIMRKLFFVIAITSVSLFARNAKAFCLTSCDPTEADGQKVFENLLHRIFGNVPFTVTSFKKTNGMSITNAPVQSYQLFFEGAIQLPQGANPDCNPNGNTLQVLSCQTMGRKFYPPGQIITYKETYVFQKTEKGWLGVDGVVY